MHHSLRWVSVLFFGAALTLLAPFVAAQTASQDQNARVLRKYMQPYAVTRLDWEVLQFNLSWMGAYTSPASHLNSMQVLFDYKNMRFRTFFRISERRDYQDPEVWSQLSRAKRESILQGAVNELRDLLSQSFPEIGGRPELIFIEFKYKQGGGGFVNIAKYENGTLSLIE
jgi:hypothetical protein